MWLRSDKRELRNRNQPKEKFKNHRKKRKRSRNQYCKTIKLMKKEKSASVLTTKQYSTDELTLYSDKSTLKVKKQQQKIKVVNNSNGSSNKKIFTTANNNKNNISSYTPDSTVNQYHHTYDLNSFDIDLNSLRSTSSIDKAPDENRTLDDYESATSEHFQSLNTHQYDDGFAEECNFDKNPSEIHAVSDILLSKSLFDENAAEKHLIIIKFSESYEERCKLTTENVSYTTEHHHFHNHHHHQEINFGYDGSSCTKSLVTTSTDSLGGAYISTEDSCNTKNLCLYKDMNYDICKTVEDDTEGTQEFLTQVENNNFNLSYATTNQSEMTQYASCSNIHNVSMIQSACYNNSPAISYSNTVNYHSAVYPSRDCNKNYEEVIIKCAFQIPILINNL